MQNELKLKVYEAFQNIGYLRNMLEWQSKTLGFSNGLRASLVKPGKKDFDYDNDSGEATTVVYKISDDKESLYVQVKGEFYSTTGVQLTGFEFVEPKEQTVTIYEKV